MLTAIPMSRMEVNSQVREDFVNDQEPSAIILSALEVCGHVKFSVIYKDFIVELWLPS